METDNSSPKELKNNFEWTMIILGIIIAPMGLFGSETLVSLVTTMLGIFMLWLGISGIRHYQMLEVLQSK